MNLFFIRHGETTGDVEQRYGGDYDDHLTERGAEQSRYVAQKLKARGLGIVISSSLQRAKETAKFIADAAGCDHVICAELKERNRYGVLTGLTKAEAKNKHPELVAAVEDRRNTIEGAETHEDFRLRIQRAFDDVVSTIVNSSVKAAGIVWHGGPMRLLFSDILRLGEIDEIADCAFVELKKDGRDWRISSTEGITLRPR